MEESIEQIWSQGEPNLLADLTQLSEAPPVTDEDEDLLPVVVTAAINGLDISEKFPTFYRKMLTNPQLQKLFWTR